MAAVPCVNGDVGACCEVACNEAAVDVNGEADVDSEDDVEADVTAAPEDDDDDATAALLSDCVGPRKLCTCPRISSF